MTLQTKIANKALEAALPIINRNLTRAIQQKGLDPYQHVIHYEETLGEVAGSSVNASVGLSNLRGLSSIQIAEFTFSDVNVQLFSDKDTTAQGTFSLHFSQDLTVDAGGTLSGKVSVPYLGSASHSEPLDASITNTGSSLTGQADFTLGSLTKLEIKSFHLNTLTLHMGENKVDIHGSLGMFDPLVNKLTGMVTDKFNTELVGHISSALKLAIQDAVNAVLPVALNG